MFFFLSTMQAVRLTTASIVTKNNSPPFRGYQKEAAHMAATSTFLIWMWQPIVCSPVVAQIFPDKSPQLALRATVGTQRSLRYIAIHDIAECPHPPTGRRSNTWRRRKPHGVAEEVWPRARGSESIPRPRGPKRAPPFIACLLSILAI